MEDIVDTRVKLSKDIAKVTGIISLVLSLIATISFVNTSNSYSSESSAVEELIESDFEDDSWVPVGFYLWSDDSNIAWKWTTDSEDYNGCDDCIYWTVDVISKYGCPSGVYGSLNI